MSGSGTWCCLIARQIVRRTGFGLIADIAIGITLLGSWLLPHLGIHIGSGIVPAISGATTISRTSSAA
jgi:uncharacterized membrane protein YeaQ/YmgE (transglycosylase-associated protein family)